MSLRSRSTPRPPREGHTTGEVAALTGLSARQLDYYMRAGAITPSIEVGRGSGHIHRWSDDDVTHLRAVAARIAWGMTPEAALRPHDPPLPAPAQHPNTCSPGA